VRHARKTVHETLDGEAIVIHLESGSYYSLTGSGAEIWSLLSSSRSAEQIIGEMARRHVVEERAINREIEAFLADLEREQLVEETADGAMEQAPEGSEQSATGPEWPSWTAPKLERFDDMKDFLLVDPVHEVDEAGWPHRRPE
jgi:hypothetical protein